MHLARGLTTTSTKKRKEKITKSQQADLEQGWRDRNQRLRSMGLPKETFEQYQEWVYGRGKKTNSKTQDRATHSTTRKVSISQRVEPVVPSRVREWVTGPCAVKQPPVYTGSKILGIATMHKSNAVPVFSDQEAVDISRMRR